MENLGKIRTIEAVDLFPQGVSSPLCLNIYVRNDLEELSKGSLISIYVQCFLVFASARFPKPLRNSCCLGVFDSF